jgi:hypothetical protein
MVINATFNNISVYVVFFALIFFVYVASFSGFSIFFIALRFSLTFILSNDECLIYGEYQAPCTKRHLAASPYREFVFVWFMVINATFNNISVILWQSVLLVEETGVPE